MMTKSILAILLTIAIHAISQPRPTIANSPIDLVPAGYTVTEKIQGDLNGDKRPDWVYVIKNTDQSKFIKNRFDHIVDRNRRGVIIALSQSTSFVLGLENRQCFSSENEDGGVYYPPELNVSIEKGNLYLHYAHGRYGYWRYNFRLQHGEFELIGYDSSENSGPIVNQEISINLLSKKMLSRVNTNLNAEMDGQEKFKETWQKFSLSDPIRLREVSDFDALDILALLKPIQSP